MKKTSVLTGAALLLAGPAVAADLAKPVYKAPPLAPGFTWTGCYIGADAGGAWGRQSAGTTTSGLPNVVVEPVIDPATGLQKLGPNMVPVTQVVGAGQADTAGDLSRGSSVIGGPYAGCNYQFRSGPLSNWVIGAEADFGWTSLSGSFDADNVVVVPPGAPKGTIVPGGGGIAMSADTHWVASVRARLGYAVMPNVLVYGTGGDAWKRTDYAGTDTFNTGGSVSTAFGQSQTGWVAGGGAEWAPWSNNWILRLEYLHYQFGGTSSTVAGVNTAPTAGPQKFNTTFDFGGLKLDTVRAGLSYKF
jgi:outer membrane immunogenic protein